MISRPAQHFRHGPGGMKIGYFNFQLWNTPLLVALESTHHLCADFIFLHALNIVWVTWTVDLKKIHGIQGSPIAHAFEHGSDLDFFRKQTRPPKRKLIFNKPRGPFRTKSPRKGSGDLSYEISNGVYRSGAMFVVGPWESMKFLIANCHDDMPRLATLLEAQLNPVGSGVHFSTGL